MNIKTKLKDIAIYGAGGFGIEVAMLIEQINESQATWNLIGFFDDGKDRGCIINGYTVLGGIETLNEWPNQLSLILAFGTPKTKKFVYERIQNKRLSYPVLIHPSVIMGHRDYVKVGEGSIICAGSIITTNIVIGKHVLISLACTVSHQTLIGDYSSFMSACNISGEVNIGSCVYFGTGAKVINKINIEDNVTVGAGAVVVRDVPRNVTVVGVPAKSINSII